jgi:LysR family hydrogen peroxide-inducible transcriptional activator
MNFQTVTYFLTLCEERNFTRAAKRCGIAQPTLTTSIKRLEYQLGGALFHRARASRSEPTTLALAIKPHFERIIQTMEAARRIAGKHRAANTDGRDLAAGSSSQRQK